MIFEPSFFWRDPLRGPGALGCLVLSLPCMPLILCAQSELETEQALDQEQSWLGEGPAPLLDSYRTEAWLKQDGKVSLGHVRAGWGAWVKSIESLPWTAQQKEATYQRLKQSEAQPCNPWYWMALPWMDPITARYWSGLFEPCSLFGPPGSETTVGATTLEAVSSWIWDRHRWKGVSPPEHSLLQYRLDQKYQGLRWALGWEYRPSNPLKETFGGYLEWKKAKNRWILGDFHLQTANLLFYQTMRLPSFVQPWQHPPGSEITRPSIRWSTGNQVRGLSLEHRTPWGRWIWSGFVPNTQGRHPLMQTLSFERQKGQLEQSWQGGLLQKSWRLGGNVAWHGANYRLQLNGLWMPPALELNGHIGRLWTLVLTPHPRWSFGIRHSKVYHTNDPAKSFPMTQAIAEPESLSILNAVWQLKPFWNLAFRVDHHAVGLEAASIKGPLQNFRYFLLFHQATTKNPRYSVRQYLRLPWTIHPSQSGEVQVGYTHSWMEDEATRHNLVLAHQMLWRRKTGSDLKLRLGQSWLLAGAEGETIMVREDQRFGNTWWRGSSTQWRLTASLQGRSHGTGWRLWIRRIQDEDGARWECSLRLTQRWTDESYH